MKKRVDRGIYELQRGLYEVVVSRGWDPARKRYAQKSQRVRGTITDARKARTRLLLEVDDGQHAGSDITLAEVIDGWLAERTKAGRAPRTISDYRYDADHVWVPALGFLPVRKITRRHIQAVLNRLIDQGLSPATLHHIRACISGAMTHAIRQDWILRDPTKPKLLVIPAADVRRAVVPTPEEVALLIKAAVASPHPWMARYIWLGAITGARPGELRALQLTALHLDEGYVGVEHAISDRVLWKTKNRKARDVGIDEVTVALVAEQVAFMQARAATVDEKLELPDDAYLFSHDVLGRRPISEDWATRFVSDLTSTLELGFTAKHLRKFMDTYGQDLGFTLAAVAARAGHDPAVAGKHYTGRVSPTDLKLSEGLAALVAAARDGLGQEAGEAEGEAAVAPG